MGFPWAVATARVNGSSELRPGYVCTSTGGGAGTVDVAKPDAADDNVFGVVECNPDQDMDTNYDDDKEVTVYLRGGGHVVWCFAKANVGAFKAGDVVVADAATDNGFVIPFTVSNAPPTAYDEATMQTELDKFDAYIKSYVGIVWEDSANDASNDRPIKVLMN